MADIYELGFDKSLDRTTISPFGSDVNEITGSSYAGGLSNMVEGVTEAAAIQSGSLPATLYYGKKTGFDDTTAGFRMGLDTSDGTYKFAIGDSSNGMDWNVTTANTLTIVGSIDASDISGSTITGSTITGGTIQTATSGQRIRITSASATTPTQAANSIGLIDSSNNLIADWGSTSGVIFHIESVATNQALVITTAYAHSSSHVVFESTSTSATGSLLDLDYAGSNGNVLKVKCNSTTNADAVLLLNTDSFRDTNFKLLINLNGVKIWKSDGTTPNGNLTGTSGDICVGYTAVASKIMVCSGTTTWVALATV